MFFLFVFISVFLSSDHQNSSNKKKSSNVISCVKSLSRWSYIRIKNSCHQVQICLICLFIRRVFFVSSQFVTINVIHIILSCMVSAQYSLLSLGLYQYVNKWCFFLPFFSSFFWGLLVMSIYGWMPTSTRKKAKMRLFFSCFESIQIDRASYAISPWIDR